MTDWQFVLALLVGVYLVTETWCTIAERRHEREELARNHPPPLRRDE